MARSISARLMRTQRNPPRPKPRKRVPPPVKPRTLFGVTSTAVPVDMAFTYRNNSPTTRRKECGVDRLPSLSVKSNMQAGMILARYQLNPIMLGGTRLSQIAACYEMYRFTKCRLVFAPVLPTTVTGSVMLAYTVNPEADLGSSANIAAFQLRGKQSNLFIRSSIDMQATTAGRWLYVDPDSGTTELTTQGTFFVILDQATNVASETSLTCYLEYEIEFLGAAKVPFALGNAVSFVAGNWTVNSSNVWTPTTILSGSLVTNGLYAINPALIIPDATGFSSTRYAGFGIYTGSGFLLAKDINAYNNNTVMDTPSGTSITATQMSIYQILPN